jgi:NAD+ synthase (glutamine-hydrolysing)
LLQRERFSEVLGLIYSSFIPTIDTNENADSILEDQNWKYVAMAACKYTDNYSFSQSMIMRTLMTDRDHFLEGDTDMHCWESLSEIIQHPDCQDILLDIGMPVKHKDVRYNCRLICYNKEILLIRPKLYLANDGNYYEM